MVVGKRRDHKNTLALLENTLMKIPRIRRSELPAYALAAVVLAAYWVPIIWWLWDFILVKEVVFPKGLPFESLVWRTCSISFYSSAISLIAAYPFVLVWRTSGSLARRVIAALMVIPLLMGLLARNYSWIGLLTNRQLFGQFGRWFFGDSFLFSITGVIVVMATIFMPMSFFILLQGARSVRREHIEASRSLGVNDWKTVFVVIIPMTYRAAVLALGFTFAFAVGFFVTPYMIGGGKYDFIGNAILVFVEFGQFQKASTIALAFLALMILPTIAVLLFAIRRRALVSGR